MARDRSLLTDFIESGEMPVWDWSLLPAQRDYLTSEAKFTMFSGGFGCGKTTVLCAKIILLLFIPGNFGYLGRHDGKALRASTMESLYEMLPKQYIAKHNDQRGFLQLRAEFGGGRLAYGDFKDLNDLKNIPLGFFAIDQTEEVGQDVWNYLDGRLRRKNPVLLSGQRQYLVKGKCKKNEGRRHIGFQNEEHCLLCNTKLLSFNETGATIDEPAPWDLVCYPNYGFGVCNPEGPSHWIFRDFPGLPGPNGLSGPGIPGYQSFHATIYDGLKAGFTKPDYVRDLEIRYKTQSLMWDRYLLGKWVEAEGLVYGTWQHESQIIDRTDRRYDGEPLIDPEAEVYEVIDHGLAAPTAVAWVVPRRCECGCESLDYYLIDEHYEREKPVSYHAACIKQHRERHTQKLVATYLDSQAFSRTLLGQKGTPRADSIYSVADEYGDYGIYPVPTQKDWDAGYNRLNELFINDPRHKHPVTGELGAPHFYAFSHCTNFLYEVESYKWKKARPGAPHGTIIEEPQDRNDHLMDALNGLMTSRPGDTIIFEDVVPDYNPDDLDLIEFGKPSHLAL